jgi:thioredoxin-like negative regulator of GroEL
MSNEECRKALKEYVSKLEQQPEEELLKKAKDLCEDGDLKGAKGLIDAAPESDDVAAKCQKEVDAYVARYNLKPNRDAVAEARRYCKKGDARSAIRVVGRPE